MFRIINSKSEDIKRLGVWEVLREWRCNFYIKVALEIFLCLFYEYKVSLHLKPGHEVSSKPDHVRMLIMGHPSHTQEGEVKIKLWCF